VRAIKTNKIASTVRRKPLAVGERLCVFMLNPLKYAIGCVYCTQAQVELFERAQDST
jgi:hypothetical protein